MGGNAICTDVVITNSYIFHSLLYEPSFRNIKDFHLNLATELIGSLGLLYYQPKNFARVISNRNQMTNITNDTTYIKIRKDTQRYCKDCSIHLFYFHSSPSALLKLYQSFILPHLSYYNTFTRERLARYGSVWHFFCRIHTRDFFPR